MAGRIPITFFAPAEREPLIVVHRQAGTFKHTHLGRKLHTEKQDYVFLLNSHRQIVMASSNIQELVTDKTKEEIIGQRPGEALGCIHASECESGCGTSPFCRQCGVVRVILKGLDGFRDMQECRLTRRVKGEEGSLHLQAMATPVVHNKEPFTLLAITRLEDKKKP